MIESDKGREKCLPTTIDGSDSMETAACDQPSSWFENRDPDSISASVHRPIQYLGNKLRSIPRILTIAQPLLAREGPVVDLFSGSSVVAQAFAAIDKKVIAVDTQLACQTIAIALLGVGRRGEIISSAQIKNIVETARNLNLEQPWRRFLEKEDAALSRHDGTKLAKINAEVPLIWSNASSFVPRKTLLARPGQSAAGVAPLFALTFGGSYFGIRQSLELDSLRWAIEAVRESEKITAWQAAVLMTALLSAMSLAVFSAGKHFAQPLTAGNARDRHFRIGRMLQDRKVDIFRSFLAAVESVSNCARPGREDHQVIGSPAEHSFGKFRASPALVYADPPYTAQQYSRFYHVLDTAITYRAPDALAQSIRTSGLYPPHRYKSAFCSKKLAPGAFEQVVSSTRASNANLLLSYSSSAKASNGNDRMIGLDEILAICRRHYARRFVSVVELEHTYRQFNAGRYSNPARNDPELLIACRC